VNGSKLVRRLRWVGVAAVTGGALMMLLFFLLLQPIDEFDLQSAAFYRESLRNVDAALANLTTPRDVELQAGAARVEIAPPLEWRVGLGGTRTISVCRARDKREESVHARTLAVGDGERLLIILTADVLVFSPELRRRTLELVRQEIPIESRDFLAVATHTHSGPGSFWEGSLPERVLGPYQERVLDFLARKFADSAIRAVANLKPARMLTDSIDVDAAIFNRSIEGGAENDDLRLIRFQGEQEPFLVDLINYSAHPTTLLPGNHSALSGDYPGIMALALESDRRTLLFTPGTIGDMRASEIDQLPGPKASTTARYLTSEGLDRMTPAELDPTVVEAYEIEVKMPPVQLRVSGKGPLDSYRLRDAVAESLLEEDLAVTSLHVVRLGPLLLFGVPCDLSASIGLPVMEYARERGFVPVILSMSNEWIGYVLTEQEYREGSYKASSQLHGPLSGPLFRAVMLRVIDRLATPQSTTSSLLSKPGLPNSLNQFDSSSRRSI
jgi:hypothetical protein